MIATLNSVSVVEQSYKLITNIQAGMCLSFVSENRTFNPNFEKQGESPVELKKSRTQAESTGISFIESFLSRT